MLTRSYRLMELILTPFIAIYLWLWTLFHWKEAHKPPERFEDVKPAHDHAEWLRQHRR